MHPSAREPAGRRNSRELVLEAALGLFLERGFAATRVEDIAQRANVSKGCVYLYFRTKDEIFEAVIDAAVVARIERAEQLATQFSGSAHELLTAMLTTNLLEFWSSSSSGIPRLILAESQQFPALAGRYFQRITLRARRLIEHILQDGVDSGEFRAIDVPYMARCILNALDHELVTQHTPGMTGAENALDPSRYVVALLELIRGGVGRAKDSAAPLSQPTARRRTSS